MAAIMVHQALNNAMGFHTHAHAVRSAAGTRCRCRHHELCGRGGGGVRRRTSHKVSHRRRRRQDQREEKIFLPSQIATASQEETLSA